MYVYIIHAAWKRVHVSPKIKHYQTFINWPGHLKIVILRRLSEFQPWLFYTYQKTLFLEPFIREANDKNLNLAKMHNKIFIFKASNHALGIERKQVFNLKLIDWLDFTTF